MSPSLDVLQQRRAKAVQMEEAVRDAVKEERFDVKHAEELLEEERQERDHFVQRRQELKSRLEAEIQRDMESQGRKPEGWENWVEMRRDEIADLIEASESRIDRLIERGITQNDELRKVLARKEYWVKRVHRLEKKIERKKDDKPGQLTPHFHVVEFDCHDGTPVPEASYPALKAACEAYLEPLREQHGAVHINSGFRTLSYNMRIGGASMSVHVYNASWQHSPWATAIDHVSDGLSPSGVQSFHESNTHPDGMGRYSVFTHVDNRNRIGWADSRWAGP